MTDFENIIVGAGPAGLQMAHHLEGASRSYLVLESGEGAGTFFTRFPRHGTLLSINKRHNYYRSPEFNLRHDWNSVLSDGGPRFTQYSQDLFPDAAEMVRYLRAFAANHELQIKYGRRVERIRRRERLGFVVADDHGDEYTAERVFLATGPVEPYVPEGIRNVELAEGYETHTLDPDAYRGQRVAIIGRGNSAFEVANHIAGHAAVVHLLVAQKVKHAWNSHYPGDLRAINNTILDMYQLKSLHATLGYDVQSIERAPGGGFRVDVVERLPMWKPPAVQRRVLEYDRVIRCTGWRYADRSLFDDDGPRLDQTGKLYALDSTWQTTVPGLYCIGTNMQARDRKAASSFIHGFRYNVRALFRLLEERHHGVAYPRVTVALRSESDVDRAANALLRRLSVTSALFQQFGFLCDAIVYDEGALHILPELPVDYVLEHPELGSAADLVLMTLEYGFDRHPENAMPLDYIHAADPTRAECSAFLHPIFRHYRRGRLQREVHLGESFDIRYDYEAVSATASLGHKNRVKNLLNSVTGVSQQVLPEGIYDDRYDGLDRHVTRGAFVAGATDRSDPERGCS